MSALDAQVGAADEAVFGTAVTPDHFVEFVSEKVKAKYGRVESKGLRPGRLYRSDSRFTTYVEGAEGDLEMEVVSKGFAFWLKHMLGQVVTSGPVDGTYTHTATPADLAGQSLTLQIGRPFYDGSSVQPFTYPGGKVTSWELANSAEENLMCTLSMDFVDELTATALATPSYPTGLETFSWAGGTVTVAGDQFDVTDASVKGDNGLKTDRRYLRGNTAKKEQIGNDYRSGEFSLTADFDSLTQRNRVASATAAGAMAEIVLNWQGLTYAAGTTYPSLTVTINARLDDFEANVSGPDALEQALSGVYLGSTAISIAYVSTDATA